MTRCECIPRKAAADEKTHPGGFVAVGEGIPKLLESLNPAARQVRAIILEHRGEEMPVTVREIAARLWPNSEPKELPNRERAVKAAVSELVQLGKMLIGSSRDAKRPGYFIIETAEELDRQRTHCLQHVRAWVRRFRALDPDGAAARELYGQLGIELGLNSKL